MNGMAVAVVAGLFISEYVWNLWSSAEFLLL